MAKTGFQQATQNHIFTAATKQNQKFK